MRDIDNGELLERLADGALYLDVRTPEEFAAGHVPGSYNVPFFFRDVSGGFVDNPEFLTIATALIETSPAPIVVACQAGGRSRRACLALESTGKEDLLHFAGGYGGGRDPFGARIPGFLDTGAQVSTQAEAGHSYAELKENGAGSPRNPSPPDRS